jgi:hypothetical protein
MTSSESAIPAGATSPGSRLIGEWTVCAIAAASSRFIPVPLLDDAVKFRAIRIAVLRTLRADGRTYSADAVEPLYAGVDAGVAGQVRRAFGYLLSVPRRVIFFPVRKYVALFGSVRGVPTDVMTVLLLAWTVHRCLLQGRLTDADADADAKRLRAEAVRIRSAFDRALHGMDLRLLSGALADGLSQGRGLTAAAVGYAGRTFGRTDDHDDDPELEPDGAVREGAERVQAILRRPEIVRLIGDFNARFDAELSRHD